MLLVVLTLIAEVAVLVLVAVVVVVPGVVHVVELGGSNVVGHIGCSCCWWCCGCDECEASCVLRTASHLLPALAFLRTFLVTPARSSVSVAAIIHLDA